MVGAVSTDEQLRHADKTRQHERFGDFHAGSITRCYNFSRGYAFRLSGTQDPPQPHTRHAPNQNPGTLAPDGRGREHFAVGIHLPVKPAGGLAT
jgi:hypothetical protein